MKREAPKPVPAPSSTDPQTVLAKACKGDAKCICINNAIFKHDSSWATKGVGKKALNPGNMRPPKTWKPSVPFTVYVKAKDDYFAKFETLEHGIIANVELYQRFYAHLPNADALVSKWAGGGGNANYRAAVRSCF
ncbi:MAG TPA: hypothetical protein VGN57_01535 [Pirellulaceae bacterium]|nr:hypothetical protein [Pirellulaceae bacterium]